MNTFRTETIFNLANKDGWILVKKCLVNELGANLHNISLLVSNRGLYASARTPTNICNTYTTQNKYKYVTTELRAQIYMPTYTVCLAVSDRFCMTVS